MAVWTWCPAVGASESRKLRVDQSELGDGYIYRATRGINPVSRQFGLTFPFVNITELNSMLDFLATNSAKGFQFADPVSPSKALVNVTADEWGYQISDTNGIKAFIGTLSVTFARAYNPQP